MVEATEPDGLHGDITLQEVYEALMDATGELKVAGCTKLHHWSDAGPHFRTQ